MFDYLQKFNQLPEDLRVSVSSPVAMAVISDLEKRYQIDLAALVIKVVNKDISLADLPAHLVSEFSLSVDDARRLTADLKERLFFSIANYLGYNPSYSAIVPKSSPVSDTLYLIKKIIRESGLNFSGSELNKRLESILNTYFKGVRSRIDTRLVLNKGVANGGLGLDHKVIDNLFLLIDQAREKQIPAPSSATTTSTPREVGVDNEALAKVRTVYEKTDTSRDIPYDLKTAIIKRQEAGLTPDQKLLKAGSQSALKAPAPISSLTAPEPRQSLKSLEVPKITPPPISDIKLGAMPEPTKDEAEIKTDLVSASTRVAIKTETESVPVPVKNELETETDAVSVLLPPKERLKTIDQPPKKKINIFKKVFSKPKEKLPPPVSPPPPIEKTSVAGLRRQARQNIPSPHLRPVAPVSKVPQPQPQSIASAPKVTPSVKPVSPPPVPPVTTPKPRTLGPVEELHYLELINFRRLGVSPKESANKIETKIRTLEADGYDRMVEGVLAWRSGEINSIYVKMAKEALKHQVTLKQIADKYESQKNSEYLTWEEVEELIALNRRLIF